MEAFENTDLFRLVRHYGSLLPVKDYEWPAALDPYEFQNMLLNVLIEGDHFKAYPPSAVYQRSFWRWIIDRIETMDAEVNEQIYRYYMEILGKNSSVGVHLLPGLPPPSYITHMWIEHSNEHDEAVEHPSVLYHRDGQRDRLSNFLHIITLLESRILIGNGSTGFCTWPASHEFANRLLEFPEIVQGKSVLELGCGVGFLGILIAQLQLSALSDNSRDKHASGRSSLWLTDYNAEILSQCKQNMLIACNKVQQHPHIKFCLLDWFEALDAGSSIHLKTLLREIDPEIIIYDPSIIPALVALLDLSLRSDTYNTNKRRQAIITLSVRNEFTVDFFIKTAEISLNVREHFVSKGNSKNDFLIPSKDSVATRVLIITPHADFQCDD